MVLVTSLLILSSFAQFSSMLGDRIDSLCNVAIILSVKCGCLIWCIQVREIWLKPQWDKKKIVNSCSYRNQMLCVDFYFLISNWMLCVDFKSDLFYPCAYAEVGSIKFFRLDDTKVLRWLCYKVCLFLLILPLLLFRLHNSQSPPKN
jgi:hypothetical protein